jgi:hypothetical protein
VKLLRNRVMGNFPRPGDPRPYLMIRTKIEIFGRISILNIPLSVNRSFEPSLLMLELRSRVP